MTLGLSASMQQPLVVSSKKLLVLGGSGFVGSQVVKRASEELGYEVVAVSRRGRPADADSFFNREESVTWRCGDLTEQESVRKIFALDGPFDAVIHCMGILFDNDSGLGDFNRLASGSGSSPGGASTYDKVTKQSALFAIEAAIEQQEQQKQQQQPSSETGGSSGRVLPFAFISAAEAGWTLPAPMEWLERYLAAKRAVEEALQAHPGQLRPVILRPSLIWTPRKPLALLSVVPFTIASKVGVPGVDRPVTLETLVDAALVALDRGEQLSPAPPPVLRFPEMDELASRLYT